jgi:hypothetical protein
MLEKWELIIGRKQHKIGKYGGDFLRKPRPDKGCNAIDDDSRRASYLKIDSFCIRFIKVLKVIIFVTVDLNSNTYYVVCMMIMIT